MKSIDSASDGEFNKIVKFDRDLNLKKYLTLKFSIFTKKCVDSGILLPLHCFNCKNQFFKFSFHL